MKLPNEPDLAIAKLCRGFLGEAVKPHVGAVYVTSRSAIKSADDVQQGALSGAARAHDGQHFSLRHLEGQIVKDHKLGGARAKNFRQPIYFQ